MYDEVYVMYMHPGRGYTFRKEPPKYVKQKFRSIAKTINGQNTYLTSVAFESHIYEYEKEDKEGSFIWENGVKVGFKGQCVFLAEMLTEQLTIHLDSYAENNNEPALIVPTPIRKWATYLNFHIPGTRNNNTGRRNYNIIIKSTRDHWAVLLLKPRTVAIDTCDGNIANIRYSYQELPFTSSTSQYEEHSPFRDMTVLDPTFLLKYDSAVDWFRDPRHSHWGHPKHFAFGYYVGGLEN